MVVLALRACVGAPTERAGRVSKVVVMSFSRDTRHRYATSSPNFGRKLGTVLAFAAGGLIACASGFALLDPEVPSARALAPATAQSSSGEKVAPVVITATPATPATPATAPAAEPKVTIAAPATETKLSANPAAETKAAEPVIEPKITNTDTVKSCPSNAGDDREGNCDSGQAQKPGIVQAKTDVPAAVVAPPVQYRVPAAIAFERAPLIAHPQAKAPSGNKVPAKEGETKSTENAGPAKQAALSSTETPATDGTRPTAETASPAEAAAPAAEVAPAPVKPQPRKAVRTQSNRRSSYEDRYYRHRNQNFFFPFFR